MARSFFDTSALVKHYHNEVGTPKVRAILNEPNAELLIARLTTVEILTGFAINIRTGVLSGSVFQLFTLQGQLKSEPMRHIVDDD